MARRKSLDPWLFELPLGMPVVGEKACLYTNRNWLGDGKVLGFIYFAGKSAGHSNIIGAGFVQELACRGYPTICGDLGDVSSGFGVVDGPGVWGNDAAVAKAEQLRLWLINSYGCKPGKVGLLYGSHGCIGAYSYAVAYPENTALIAGGIGTCDVENIRANNISGYQASIETAYTNNANWQSKRSTHNPVEVAASLSALGIRQLDYYSPTDAVCLASTHANLLTNAGSMMTQRSLGNIGHSFTGLGPRQPTGLTQNAEVAPFVDWVETYLP